MLRANVAQGHALSTISQPPRESRDNGGVIQKLRKFPLAWAILALALYAQDAPYPLESVAVEGTRISRETVMELAGLRIGAPVNKAAIEQACGKLQEAGIFQSIDYHYAPGPKRGYVLTLKLTDPALSEAAIDILGIDENEVWQWLSSRYPDFNHKTPTDEAAQKFLARQIETHLGPKLEGQHIVPRAEGELGPRGKMRVAFQVETLPRVASMNFTGNSVVSSSELDAIMEQVAGNQEYTGRGFRQLVELNLRRACENHGMYRARFPEITARKTGRLAVAVTTSIVEGSQFMLGDVQLVGEDLPAAAMLAAAGFKKGEVANAAEIQKSIWELEKPLKRTGYFAAAARPERILHDDSRVLDLNIAFDKGPLYHFGQIQFTGLSADLESKARKIWKPKTGDPYDYQYPSDFLQSFFRSVDGRQFKKYRVDTRPAPGNVMDITVIFEPK